MVETSSNILIWSNPSWNYLQPTWKIIRSVWNSHNGKGSEIEFENQIKHVIHITKHLIAGSIFSAHSIARSHRSSKCSTATRCRNNTMWTKSNRHFSLCIKHHGKIVMLSGLVHFIILYCLFLFCLTKGFPSLIPIF